MASEVRLNANFPNLLTLSEVSNLAQKVRAHEFSYDDPIVTRAVLWYMQLCVSRWREWWAEPYPLRNNAQNDVGAAMCMIRGQLSNYLHDEFAHNDRLYRDMWCQIRVKRRIPRVKKYVLAYLKARRAAEMAAEVRP